MKSLRIVVAALTVFGSLLSVAPAQAHPMCNADGPPAGAATQPFTGGTLWISPDGLVGVTTPDGTGTVRVPSASPIPLQAMVINASDTNEQQLIISDGRSAHLYVLVHCWISETYNGQGEPFIFDLQNLRGRGTGVGCQDLGDGRHLVALQALPDFAVNRTEVDLNGTTALLGRSDTVTGTSAQDPLVLAANTITCGEQAIGKDGVQQP